MEEPHVLIILLLCYQLLSWRGRILRPYHFWAHGCPLQSVENHFVSLAGICSYIGTKRMVWLSSNCYYEWHRRLWQRPLVILGKGYGLARLELDGLLGTVACNCATVVQSVQGWTTYETYLGKAPWCKRALQAKAHNVNGHGIAYAVRWDFGEHWGQQGTWKWPTSFHNSCRLASQCLRFLIYNVMILVLLSAPTDISSVKISDDWLFEEVGLQSCQSVSTEVYLPHKQYFELPSHQTTLCSPQCLFQLFKIFPLPLQYLSFPCCLLYSSVPYNDFYNSPPKVTGSW